MNFGMKLPGPFRVSRSRSGRYAVGASVGPFSVSTGIGQPTQQGGQPFWPISVEDAVAELVVAGWTPTYADAHTAFVQKGWQAARIDAVAGGVTWEQITSRRTMILKTVLWLGLAILVFSLCSGSLG